MFKIAITSWAKAPAMGLLASLALALASPAMAQTFPNKVVKLVVPQTPGGATDVFARAVGQKLSERWGHPVVVENRAGAAGVVGTDAVAKSAPDGYTLLVTYAGSQAINPALYKSIPFDSIKDFQTIATVAQTPFALVVRPGFPAKDMPSFVKFARETKDAPSFASSGNGSVNHLLGEMLKMDSGIRYVHVPYKGISQAITDLLGGQVDFAFTSLPSVLPNIKSGKIHALAVTSARRVAVAPDIPTIAESGVPQFDVNPWWGVLGPAGMDKEVVRKINADINDILKSKEMIDFLATQGAEPLITTPDEFLDILKSDTEKWAKVVKASGVHIN